MDLADRLLLGVYFYPLLFLILGVATPFRSEHPSLYWPAFSACLAAMCARALISHARKKIYGRSPALLHLLLAATVLLTSGTSGVLYASSVLHYGLESWTFALVMMFMVGTASGSTVSFTPDLRLLTTHLGIMFLPALVCGFRMGTNQGRTFVTVTIALLVFLLLQGRRLNSIYWHIIRDSALEAARTRELEIAKAAAVAASLSKSGFLANMSHEIRTPMHGILGMAQLAIDAETHAEARELLHTLRQSASGLLGVLNDILDFSKVEAGKLTLENTSFSLPQVVRETVNIVIPQANAKGLKIRSEVDPEIPERLIGDPARLRQVLVNLVGNGIKFTNSGSVRLEIELMPADFSGIPGKTVALLFRVSDTGIGIAQDQQELIFEAFAQANASVARRFGGTGLGLAICSQLVHLMGGKLRVQSQPGQGSTFEFSCTLGVAPAHAIPSPAKTPVESVPPMRILLAEDNAISQNLATRLLKRKGHEVVVVSTGKEAVAAWESSNFDLILMDNQMPEMDGIEAVTEIRAREQETRRSQTPIIACSASAMTTEVERFLAAGMDATLSKPFSAAELEDVLRTYSPARVGR